MWARFEYRSCTARFQRRPRLHPRVWNRSHLLGDVGFHNLLWPLRRDGSVAGGMAAKFLVLPAGRGYLSARRGTLNQGQQVRTSFVLQPEPKTAAFFVGTARLRSNWADSLTSNCTEAPSLDRGFILNPRAVL